MGKSYRKKVDKWADSDKAGKQISHRKFRRETMKAIKKVEENPEGDIVFPESEKEVYDVWSFPNEGEKYVHYEDDRDKYFRRPPDKRDILNEDDRA